MKKFSIFLLSLFMGLTCIAQKPDSRIDLRWGVGSSLLGTGDILTLMIENEVNFKLNQYFSLSGGVAYAKNSFSVIDQASFIQLNSNVYLSPFKNNGKNDLRIGAGLSWYSISDIYAISGYYLGREFVVEQFVLDKRNSLGFNMIIEDTYAITNRFLLGLRLFSQPYLNGDINSGILIKFGLKL